jgi:hypothetical protein
MARRSRASAATATANGNAGAADAGPGGSVAAAAWGGPALGPGLRSLDAEILPDHLVLARWDDDAAGAGQTVRRGLGHADADCGNAQCKRQTARRCDRDANAGEVPGPGTDADHVDIRPSQPCLGQQFLKHWKQPFSLSLGHVFVTVGQNPVTM